MKTMNERIIEVATKEFPKFSIESKRSVWHQRVLGYLMFWMWSFPKDETGKRRFVSKYMTRFTTTMGVKIFVVDLGVLNRKSYWRVLAHEFVHLMDAKRLPPFVFPVMYMFPQNIGLLALLGLGVFWVPVLKWSFLALIFVLPWPAAFRAWAEFRGYTMSMAATYWDTGEITDSTITWCVDNFTSPSYWFMWPFRKSLTARFETAAERIKSGAILEDPIFETVYDAHRTFLLENA